MAVVNIPGGALGVEYRTVEGFEWYAVGNDGSVWSSLTKGSGRRSDAWWRMKPYSSSSSGHRSIALRKDGRYHKILVHRLVLLTFIGQPPDGKPNALHKFGDPTDNRLSGLYWGDQEDNSRDSETHGTMCVGEKHPGAKLTSEKVREIRRLHSEGVSRDLLAEQFGVSGRYITSLANREKWRHVE